MLSFGFLGLSFMMSSSGTSVPSAIAGRASVSKLTQRIWRGRKGIGIPIRKTTEITITSSKLAESRKRMNFLRFLYMTRPLSTVSTIVAKLSSVRIMSPASLATSVPVTPMAIPMSAALRAGASFTPSPVMATMCPLRLKALRIFTLCFGLTRANMRIFSQILVSSCSVILSKSAPVRILSPFL